MIRPCGLGNTSCELPYGAERPPSVCADPVAWFEQGWFWQDSPLEPSAVSSSWRRRPVYASYRPHRAGWRGSCPPGLSSPACFREKRVRPARAGAPSRHALQESPQTGRARAAQPACRAPESPPPGEDVILPGSIEVLVCGDGGKSRLPRENSCAVERSDDHFFERVPLVVGVHDRFQLTLV